MRARRSRQRRELGSLSRADLGADALKEGDIVIIDNFGSHKGNKIQRAIRTVEARLLFLPPYSPEFNPIEQALGKLKALLRTAEERTLEARWRRIGSLLDAFSRAERTNNFRNCGYGSR